MSFRCSAHASASLAAFRLLFAAIPMGSFLQVDFSSLPADFVHHS
jgi:hypothetical protein